MDPLQVCTKMLSTWDMGRKKVSLMLNHWFVGNARMEFLQGKVLNC